MCGRYGRRADKQRIAEWFCTHNTNVFKDSAFDPTYNAAPQSFQPVIRLNSETGERELSLMIWELVPHWSKTIKSNYEYDTFNANADNLTTSKYGRNLSDIAAAWSLQTGFTNGCDLKVAPMIVRRGHMTGPAVPSAVPKEVKRFGDEPLKAL
jgi:hypothetical protein